MYHTRGTRGLNVQDNKKVCTRTCMVQIRWRLLRVAASQAQPAPGLQNNFPRLAHSNTPHLDPPPSPERCFAAGVSPGSAFSFSGVSAMRELAMKMPESWKDMTTAAAPVD